MSYLQGSILLFLITDCKVMCFAPSSDVAGYVSPFPTPNNSLSWYKNCLFLVCHLTHLCQLTGVTSPARFAIENAFYHIKVEKHTEGSVSTMSVTQGPATDQSPGTGGDSLDSLHLPIAESTFLRVSRFVLIQTLYSLWWIWLLYWVKVR